MRQLRLKRKCNLPKGMQQSIRRTRVADSQSCHFCSPGEVASNRVLWGLNEMMHVLHHALSVSVPIIIIMFSWVFDLVPRLQKNLPIILTQPPHLQTKIHWRYWSFPWRENILRLWGHCLQNTREGLFSLGNGALSHESFFRFCVGDLGFLRKLLAVTHYWLVWSEAQKPDPVLFPKSHEPFCSRHSRNTLSVSLNNVTKRQSHHWKWPCGY